MNIIGYINKFKNTFAESPFNEVDSVVLCQLAYLRFGRRCAFAPRLTLAQLACDAEKLCTGTPFARYNKRLLAAAAGSVRFADVRVGYFRTRTNRAKVLNYTAVTFFLPNAGCYVAYRGTDTSLVGWKEDFYMSFLQRIPSHTLAEQYLQLVADATDGPIMVGGHSKGGNLAVHAAVNAPAALLKRVTAVFDHDGPGFRDPIYDTPAYAQAAPLIHKTVPRDSFVGVVLCNCLDYEVVDCNSMLMMQHNPFSWLVTSDGHFKKLPQTSFSSRVFDATLTEWINGMDMAARRKLVGSLFAVLEGSGCTCVTDMAKNLVASVRGMYRAYKMLDDEGRELMSHGGKRLLRLWLGTIVNPLPSAGK